MHCRLVSIEGHRNAAKVCERVLGNLATSDTPPVAEEVNAWLHHLNSNQGYHQWTGMVTCKCPRSPRAMTTHYLTQTVEIWTLRFPTWNESTMNKRINIIVNDWKWYKEVGLYTNCKRPCTNKNQERGWEEGNFDDRTTILFPWHFTSTTDMETKTFFRHSFLIVMKSN